MAKILIEVWSDYVCPFCYLQMPALKEVLQQGDVQVHWRAYELRPEPSPLLDPQSAYLRRSWEGSVFPLAERLGVVLRLPPVQPRSRKALETAEYARHKGKFEAIHEVLFKAFFVDGKDISQTRVLLDLAAGIGLDPVDLLGTLEAKEYTPKVLGDQKLAHRLGIHAVPALLFHYPQEPVEAGAILTATQDVQELEDMIERMKASAPPEPPPPPPKRKQFRR